LNAAGEVLYAEAKQILLRLSQAVSATQSTSRGETGVLTIGYTKRASYSLLPALLRRLSSELPDIRLELLNPMTTDALYSRVTAREIDLALTYLNDTQDDWLAAEELTVNELVVVLPARHAFAKGQHIELKQLAHESFVAYPSTGGFYLRRLMESACEAAGFRPIVTNESSDTEALLCLVATGRYVSILPREVQAYGFEGLAYCGIADLHIAARHGCVWHKQNTNPPLHSARKMLGEIAASKR